LTLTKHASIVTAKSTRNFLYIVPPLVDETRDRPDEKHKACPNRRQSPQRLST
jgi:hypothetical protein